MRMIHHFLKFDATSLSPVSLLSLVPHVLSVLRAFNYIARRARLIQESPMEMNEQMKLLFGL